MAMAVGKTGYTSVKSEPNVVPMIDIMLVLLIIFMIVTPLLASGFRATMPKADNLDASPEEEGEVILGIDEGGRFFSVLTLGRLGCRDGDFGAAVGLTT